MTSGASSLRTAFLVERAMSTKLGPIEERRCPGCDAGRHRPHRSPARPYVSTTYASIAATCPPCPFKGSPARRGGCYVYAGADAARMNALDRAAWGLSSLDVLKEEVWAIDSAFGGGPVPQDGARGGRDLRLHVGGDVDGPAGTLLLARAAGRWNARGGGTVWTYTHRWKTVPRGSWGRISVLASVERAEDIEDARSHHYAAAIVVPEFPNGGKAYRISGTTTKLIPCPAERQRGLTCIECRLCLDRDLLRMNAAIAFRAHGRDQATAKKTLPVINNSSRDGLGEGGSK